MLKAPQCRSLAGARSSLYRLGEGFLISTGFVSCSLNTDNQGSLGPRAMPDAFQAKLRLPAKHYTLTLSISTQSSLQYPLEGCAKDAKVAKEKRKETKRRGTKRRGNEVFP